MRSDWVTFNLWRGNPDPLADLLEEMRRDQTHVIVLQEAANHIGVISTAVRLASAGSGHDWRAVIAPRGLPRGARNIVVLYRNDVLRAGRRKFIDMPNPRVSMDRWVAELVLNYRRTRKRRRVVLFGTHIHPHIEKRAWWRLPRQDEAREHIDWLVWRCRRVGRRSAAMVAADWNINLRSRIARLFRHFPTKSFAKIGMRHNFDRRGGAYRRFDRGTKGRRFIDAFFSRLKPWFRQVDVDIVRKRSDHDLVRVTMEVTL